MKIELDETTAFQKYESCLDFLNREIFNKKLSTETQVHPVVKGFYEGFDSGFNVRQEDFNNLDSKLEKIKTYCQIYNKEIWAASILCIINEIEHKGEKL